MSLQLLFGCDPAKIAQIVSNAPGKSTMTVEAFVVGLAKAGVDMTGQTLPSEGISHNGIIKAIRTLRNIPEAPKYEPLSQSTIQIMFFGVLHMLSDIVALDKTLFEPILTQIKSGKSFISSCNPEKTINIMRRLVSVPRFDVDDIITSIEICKKTDIFFCSRNWLNLVLGTTTVPYAVKSEAASEASDTSIASIASEASEASTTITRKADSDDEGIAKRRCMDLRNTLLGEFRGISFYRIDVEDQNELRPFGRAIDPAEINMSGEQCEKYFVWGNSLGVKITRYHIKINVLRYTPYQVQYSMKTGDGPLMLPSLVARVNKLAFDRVNLDMNNQTVPSICIEFFGSAGSQRICDFLIVDENRRPYNCTQLTKFLSYAEEIFMTKELDKQRHVYICKSRGADCVVCNVNVTKCRDPKECTDLSYGHIMLHHLNEDGTVEQAMFDRLRQY